MIDATGAAAPMVLVVDDDQDGRDSLALILGIFGFSTAVAGTAAEALRMATEHPDAILLDVRLPDLSGVEVCRRLKADPATAGIPVLILSGYAVSAGEQAAGLEGGADAYLTKPADPQVVAAYTRGLIRARRTEEELRLRDRAMQAVTQGIVISDPTRPDDPIAYVSPGFERLTGYAAAEVVGRNCRFLQGPGTDPEAATRLRDAVRRREACTIELLNYRKDGTPFWNELSVAPVRDAAGRPTHLVGVQADRTERRRLAEHVRQAQRVEAVGQLAGGVAHDFNTLLTIILGNGELLRERLGAEHPHADLIADLMRAAERSVGLTQQLLAFSRQQVLDPQVLDLNAVVADTARMLRRVLGAGVQFDADLAPDLGEVLADPGQVGQVLVNLGVNARDAMPTGGRLTFVTRNVTLDAAHARAHPGARPGPHAVLEVTDTGGGMTADVKARMFEPFFTTKGPGKGTGLGLAVVHGVVAQSGGHLDVDTAPGAGTTFRIYLPLADVSDSTPPPRGALRAKSAK